jgi:pSer/pThr/pTyr-binding forkhead associated (FHA) protein
MEVRLLVSHPTAETKQIRLGSETLIGRSTECNMRIASGQVSRRHCLIQVAGASVTVRDLKSANGTRLNGLTIAPEVDVAITPGSTLVVGPLKFVVQFAPPREKGDEDTEFLPGGSVAGKSGTHEIEELASAPIADGEETKDFPRTQQRLRGKVPPVIVGQAGGKSPDAAGSDTAVPEHASDGTKTDPDFPPVSVVDAGDTIYDGSLKGDADPSIHSDEGSKDRTRARNASETQLYFEEDDIEKLASSGDPDEDLRKFLEGQ